MLSQGLWHYISGMGCDMVRLLCHLGWFVVWVAVAGAQTTVIDADGTPVVIRDTSRIVAIGGPVTEIVYALGVGCPAGRC